MDVAFLATLSCTAKSLGVGTRCELTRLNLQYCKVVNEVLVDHRADGFGGRVVDDATV